MGHPRARMFDLIDADENGSISKFEMFEAVKAVASTCWRPVCLVLGNVKKTHGETSRVLLNFRCVFFKPKMWTTKTNETPRKTVARDVVRNAQKLTTGWWFQIFNLIIFLGKWSNLTSIFFKGVGSTTNQTNSRDMNSISPLASKGEGGSWKFPAATSWPSETKSNWSLQNM